jgi:hypothetical protein
MLAFGAGFCYSGKTIHIMKTFANSACLVLLAAWAGNAVSPAQTAPPAAAPATNATAAAARMPSRRFSGKILTVDTTAKTITLQGAAKVVVGITDKTKITRAKKPATFDVLAADQAVVGIERQDAAGLWHAETLNVGDPRQLLTEPAPKVVIAPDIKK